MKLHFTLHFCDYFNIKLFINLLLNCNNVLMLSYHMYYLHSTVEIDLQFIYELIPNEDRN